MTYRLGVTGVGFRQMTLSDVPTVYQIYLQSPADIDPERVRPPTWLAAIIDDATQCVDVVLVNDTVVGLVSVWPDATYFGLTVFLASAFRRKGLGTVTVARAMVLAQKLAAGQPSVTEMRARVFRHNLASYRLFLRVFGPPTHMEYGNRWNGQYIFTSPF